MRYGDVLRVTVCLLAVKLFNKLFNTHFCFQHLGHLGIHLAHRIEKYYIFADSSYGMGTVVYCRTEYPYFAVRLKFELF